MDTPNTQALRGNMEIDINLSRSLDDGMWFADLQGLPGSPPIGNGKTKEMAVACLFFRIISEWETWGKYLTPLRGLSINNEAWVHNPGCFTTGGIADPTGEYLRMLRGGEETKYERKCPI